MDTLQARTSTRPAPSPTISSPGAFRFAGSECQPPLVIVLAPHADPLAAVEDPVHEAMRLELLQQVVGRQLQITVVEPSYEPERDRVVAHGVYPRAAELAVLRALPNGQPSVCTILSRGFATRQTSLTPSSHNAAHGRAARSGRSQQP